VNHLAGRRPESSAPLRLVRGHPDLVRYDRHHEDEVEAERPEDGEFGAFEVAAGDGVLFCFDQLVVFEG
jgi:hypothetical protein